MEALSDSNYAYSMDQNNPSLLNRGIAKEMLRDEEGAYEDWLKAVERKVKRITSIIVNKMKYLIALTFSICCVHLSAQNVDFKANFKDDKDGLKNL